MKTLNSYLFEKFKLGKNQLKNPIVVKTTKELYHIVYERYKEHFDHLFKRIDDGDLLIDLSDIDVSNIDDFSFLFGIQSRQVQIIDITGWNTSKATNMAEMFFGCRDLEKIIGIEDIDVSKVTQMDGMFAECCKLKEIDIEKWNISDKCCCKDMFNGCKNLEKIKGIEKLANVSNKNILSRTKILKSGNAPSWYEIF